MTRARILRAAVVVVLAAAGLGWMNSLGRLQWPSVLVYSGLVTLLCGILSTLLPPAWLGFSRRSHGLLAAIVGGGAFFAAGWFWPVSFYSTPAPASRLDAYLPVYQFHERHELIVQAPAERVREALDHVSFAEIEAIQVLGQIRGFVMSGHWQRINVQHRVAATPVLDMVKQPRSGFFPLDDTPREFVFGLAGQPWNNKPVRLSAEEFRTWALPGQVKIAANFLIQDAGPGRSRLITETRIAATDESAMRTMARYWALVYPGSGMTRWGLLNAIRARAERL
ncbi:hypothetical protein [uncultured Paludibaculum sp.]|uniref:hypothetical protein n=1 Tax=uncultured Paludibaculum sp. TaxID=1765020 RepID=UPI002AABF2B4|nr:hypothetical protein [uncultured Paludibaculum sp.]